MIIKSLELADFRNYDSLHIDFSSGTNILYGDNAQGKTNILEAIYLCATTKSHKGSKDKDIVNFNKEEAHIRTYLEKDNVDMKIDMHLRKSKTKGIAIDGQKIKKAAELLGLLNVVFFSPEDLSIIKNGPAERRRFVDMELCQLDQFYLYNLNHYNKIVNQRNKLLKDMYFNPSLRDTLNIWDSQLISFGSKIIERRQLFVEQLNEIIYDIYKKISQLPYHLLYNNCHHTAKMTYNILLHKHLDNIEFNTSQLKAIAYFGIIVKDFVNNYILKSNIKNKSQ